MFRNNLIIAWRHLRQSKGFSFINIFGLATGMAFAILIALWIDYETSFDRFHTNGDRIAMVLKNTFFNNKRNTEYVTPMPLYNELKEHYPEVAAASRLRYGGTNALSTGAEKFKRSVLFVDPEFLTMFSFPVVNGNIKTALNDPYSIVITQSTATVLFGNISPIGKAVRINNDYNVKVSAIVQDIPKNSTIQFDYLAPLEYLAKSDGFVANQRANWGNNFLTTVVQLKEGASMDGLSKKIKYLNTDKDKTLKDLFLFLHPLKDWHLRNDYKNWVQTGGRATYIKLFGLIGVFVLLIACINFMNLSTARSEKRAREVGIRKAIGSFRSQLIGQFLTETLLTTLIAFALALIVVPLTLPLLKDLGFEYVRFDLNNGKLLGGMLVIAVVTGLIAGSYPALYLSSFAPVKVLKGFFKQELGTVAFRKTLVIVQFAISIGLIVSTAIVFKQIQHARSRSLGYNPNNLVWLPGSKDLMSNFVPFKQELMNNPYIASVAKTAGPLTEIYNSWSDFSWEGKDPNAQQALDVVLTEWDFEKTAGLHFIQGRPFSIDHKTDSNAVILNEAALQMIGYKDPIGKTMKSANRDLTIIGIVKNMLIEDPYQPIRPTVLLFSGGADNFVYLRLKQDVSPRIVLPLIQAVFEKYSAAVPFEYHFSDEDFEAKFRMEKQVGKLTGIFAVLGVLISSLGLFGLAAFMAERRSKEIGIRKVLGASITGLWALLSKDFVVLVMVGCVVGSSIAYWLMSGWLQQYDYRISVQWSIFALAALAALAIALITVSAQAIRAALSNPIKSLRSE